MEPFWLAFTLSLSVVLSQDTLTFTNTDLGDSTLSFGGNCPSASTCRRLRRDQNIIYTFSSTNYQDIELQFGLTVDSQDGISAICEVSYSYINQGSYITLQQYSSDAIPATVQIPSNATDQTQVDIQFLNTGAHASQDNCYIDSVEVTATLIPATPTPVTPSPVTPNPVTPDPVSANTPNPTTPNPTTPDPTSTNIPGVTSSIPAQYYFIDAYDFFDVTMPGNVKPSIQEFGNDNLVFPSNAPFIAFPLDICTRRGDDIAGDNQYIVYDCDQATGLYKCGSGNFLCPDMTCDGSGNDQNVRSGYRYQDQDPNEIWGGKCDTSGANPQPQNTHTANYMKIDYYTNLLGESPDGCPGIVQGSVASNRNLGFEYEASDYFATNICVKQTTNTYVMYVLYIFVCTELTI